MSFMDKAKGALGRAMDRAGGLAGEHATKIDQAIDKGGSMLDQKTSGQYSGKVDKAREAAKSARGKLAARQDVDEPGGAAAPAPPPGAISPAAETTDAEPTDVEPTVRVDPNRP